MKWFYLPTNQWVKKWLLLASLACLGAPAQAATFTVTNLNDSGAGSLRQALSDANVTAISDTIVFQSGLTGTITLTSGELPVSAKAIITGPGASVLAISGNNASRVFNVSAISVTISGLTIKNGKVAEAGAGIHISAGAAILNDLVLSNNISTGYSGGAIYSSGLSLNIDSATLTGNEAENGGAIYVNNSSAVIRNSTISDNAIPGNGYGGGIYINAGSGAATLVNNTISGNATGSGGSGGGIYIYSPTATLINNTISGNASGGNGGGVYVVSSTATLINNTIVGNSAFYGSGIYNNSSTLNLANNIIAGNDLANGTSIYSGFTSQGNNLFGENAVSGLTNPENMATSDLVLAGAIATAVAPLANNGGPTQTQALVTGSPAIDAGNSALVPAYVTTDQRGTGFARIVGTKVDIGAYEYGAVNIMHALIVTKTGTGTIKSVPDGINCGATCSANFADGTVVALTATPTSPATFTSWGGACSGTTNTCNVTMSAVQNVSASFALPNHTLIVTVAGTGTGSVSSTPTGINNCTGQCITSFTHGTNVTLTATITSASSALSWSGACTGTATSCAVAMTAPKTTTATINTTTNLPDFVVTGITVTPTGPVVGDTFSAAITVKNQGTLAGNAGNLMVWANQATAQVCKAVGNKVVAVGALAAGVSKTFTVTGLIAGIRGNKQLRAFVDAACVTAETNDANNQATKTYRVTNVPGLPDIVVTAMTLVPATPAVNSNFSATITVQNQGTVAADGGYLDVWANQSTVQRCGAEGDAWVDVGVLAAGGIKTVTVSLPAGTAGNKTLRALADSWCEIIEANKVNNQMAKAYTVQ